MNYKDRKDIFRLHYERGVSISRLAEIYGVTRADIYTSLLRMKQKNLNKINYKKVLKQYHKIRKEYDINVEKMIDASIKNDKVKHKKYIAEEQRLNNIENRLKTLIDFIDENRKKK